MTTIGSRPRALLLALHILAMGAFAAPAPAAAMQILDAADHAELAAEVSATNVNRIALAGDRIAKVVRSPDGFAVEHDPRSGDLYLRPSGRDGSDGTAVTLFIGTERGFTYRLTLTPAARNSAQILIRNAAALPDAAVRAASPGASAHVAALVELVRAVARRAPLPGYEIRAGRRVCARWPDLHRDLAGPAPRGARLRGRASGIERCGRGLARTSIRARGLAGTIEGFRESGASPRCGWRRRTRGRRAGGSASP